MAGGAWSAGGGVLRWGGCCCLLNLAPSVLGKGPRERPKMGMKVSLSGRFPAAGRSLSVVALRLGLPLLGGSGGGQIAFQKDAAVKDLGQVCGD